jgi:hypothetical protein
MKKVLSLFKRNLFSLIVILMFLSAGTVLFSGCGSGGRGGPTSLAPSSTSPLVSPAITATIPLSASSTGAGSFSPNGQYFYASTGNGVDVINTVTGALVKTLTVSGTPHGPITFSGPSSIYVQTTASDIYAIDPLNNTIGTSSSTTAVAGTFPSNKHTDGGYTIWGWANKLSIVSLPSLTVAGTINPVDSSMKYSTDPGEWTAVNPIYPYGYVSLRGSGNVFVVDLNPSSSTYGTVIKTIPVMVSGTQTYGPCDATVSSNGNYLYVPVFGATGFGEPAVSPGYVLVIDVNPNSPTYGQIIQQVDAPSGFTTIMATVAPNNQYLAIEGSGGELYYTVNPSTGLITNPTSPYELTSLAGANTDEFTPGSNRDFVMDGSDVYVVTMVNGTSPLVSPAITATIPLSASSTGAGSFSPNGQYFYASTGNGVDVINTVTGALVKTLTVSGTPHGPITFSGPSSIYVQTTASDIYAIDPLNNTIGTSSSTTAVAGTFPSNKHTDGGYTIWGWANKLSIVSLPSLTVAGTINPVDSSMKYSTDPGEWTAVNPIYPYGYVSLRGSGNVFVVDLNPSSSTYGTVIKTIPVMVSGTQTYGPCDATVSSNGNYLYVPVFGATGFGEPAVSPGYVLVIDVNPNSPTYGQIIQQVDAPSGFTTIMATVAPNNQYLAIEGSGGELYYTVNPSTGLITNPTSPYELTSLAGANTDEFTPGSNRDFVMDGSDVYVVTMVP